MEISYNPNFTKLDHQVSNMAAFSHPKLELKTTLLSKPSENGGREHDEECRRYVWPLHPAS